MPRFDRVVCLLGVHLVTLAAAASASADPLGANYDPPIGSQWTLHSQWREDDTRIGKTTTMTVTYTAQFTIEEKTPGGFRISYVMRDLDIQGSTSQAALSKILLQPQIGVVAQIDADQNGKPVRVENFPEVQAAYQKGVADAVAAIAAHASPESASKARAILDANTPQDAEKAAEKVDDLSLLSLAQNAGLSLNEVRSGSQISSSPFSAEPISTTTSLSLTSNDVASGKQMLVRTETYDPIALKRYALDAFKKLSPDAAAKMDEIAAQMSTTRVDRAEFTVERGMTTGVAEDTTLEIKEADLTMTKRQRKEVTVTPWRPTP